MTRDDDPRARTSPFARAPRHRRDDDASGRVDNDGKPKRHTFEALKGERVVVRSNGFEYRGVLIGADEEELYLRGEMRWVVLPLSMITDVKRDVPERVALGGWRPPEDER